MSLSFLQIPSPNPFPTCKEHANCQPAVPPTPSHQDNRSATPTPARHVFPAKSRGHVKRAGSELGRMRGGVRATREMKRGFVFFFSTGFGEARTKWLMDLGK